MKLLACQRENNVIESEEEEEDGALRDDVGVEQGDEELSDSHQDNSMRLLVSDEKGGGQLESEEENSLGKDLAAREPGVETEVEEEEAEIFGSFEKIEKSEIERLLCSGLRNRWKVDNKFPFHIESGRQVHLLSSFLWLNVAPYTFKIVAMLTGFEIKNNLGS